MGRIPEKFIDDLLLRVDIVELIDARVPLRKMGKDYKACCPFHEEKTPSFTVSVDKQFYHCFGCGAHGTAIGFLIEYERMSFPEALEELAKRAGMTLPRGDFKAADGKAESDATDLIGVLQQANRFYQRQLREHPQAQQAVDYLKKRGLSGAVAADFGVGYAADGWSNLLHGINATPAMQMALFQAGLLVKKEGGGYYDRFRNRVMFPIHDYRGRIIGFGGRVLGQGEPKYLNSPETPLFHKGRELYGLFRARDALKREQRAVVVEGYMDVIALAQFGIDYAVATLGTATTRDHLERLFRFVPDVIFCFDGDKAGREAAWRALQNAMPVVHAGRQVSFLFLPDGEDPDSLVRKEGGEAFAARLRQPLPLPDFLFQTLGQEVDLNRLDGRAKLVELARPLLSKMTPDSLQQLMVARLAELSRLEPDKLMRLLEAKAATKAAKSAKTAGDPSLMRTMLALVLQNPALAKRISDFDFLVALELPGADLLRELLTLLQDQPELNTAAIMERFKDSKHQPTLVKLAIWDHPNLKQDITVEFDDLLLELRKGWYKQEIERLNTKCRLMGLNAPENADLKRLLDEKRKLGRSSHTPP